MGAVTVVNLPDPSSEGRVLAGKEAPMLTYCAVDREQTADHDWIWIESPTGERYLLLDREIEVRLSDEAVQLLARQVEWGRTLGVCSQAS